jgi:large subunit ribosomal protein L17
MRHGKKFNHLSRKNGHRKALLRNLTISLVKYKRIKTTIAKAKELRKFIEPLLTKSKNNTTHSRRVVYSYLQNKEAVTEMFTNIAPVIANRPGGYIRIVRLGFRPSDAAEVAMIEFVDFNTVALNAANEAAESDKKRTRRGRKKKSEENEQSDEVNVTETTVNNLEIDNSDSSVIENTDKNNEE